MEERVRLPYQLSADKFNRLENHYSVAGSIPVRPIRACSSVGRAIDFGSIEGGGHLQKSASIESVHLKGFEFGE